MIYQAQYLDLNNNLLRTTYIKATTKLKAEERAAKKLYKMLAECEELHSTHYIIVKRTY